MRKGGAPRPFSSSQGRAQVEVGAECWGRGSVDGQGGEVTVYPTTHRGPVQLPIDGIPRPPLGWGLGVKLCCLPPHCHPKQKQGVTVSRNSL